MFLLIQEQRITYANLQGECDYSFMLNRSQRTQKCLHLGFD